jgi:transcriptional regulator with XRE-family HTH domain
LINVEELKKEIGKKLKRAREGKGLSQEELAKQIGLSKVGYGAFERGSNLIALNYLLELSRILQKPVTYFFPIHTLTEAELNDITHDPRFQSLMVAWQSLAALDDPEPCDVIHDLAIYLAAKHAAKED